MKEIYAESQQQQKGPQNKTEEAFLVQTLSSFVTVNKQKTLANTELHIFNPQKQAIYTCSATLDNCCEDRCERSLKTLYNV